MFTKIFLTCLFMLLSNTWARDLPKLPHTLSEKDFKIIESGDFVVKKKNINKSSWPELTIYSLIEASPLESMAIFAAFDHQKNYLPNFIKSEVIKVIKPTEIHTEYEMKMPWPITNGKYVHQTILDSPKDGIYSISWSLVRSNAAERVYGRATFLPFKKAKTLFVYKSFIDPKSFLAGLFKKNMISDVKASLSATRNEIYRAREQDKNLLQKYINKLEESLKGITSYSTD